MQWVILLAGTINLSLGFFVAQKAPPVPMKRPFVIFVFFTALWIVSNFICSISPSALWFKTAYALGALIPSSALVWVLTFPMDKGSRISLFYIGYGIGFLFFILCYIPSLFLQTLVVLPTGVKEIYGPAFGIYAIYMAGILLFLLFKMFTYTKILSGFKREQAKYMFLGAMGFASISFLVSFILPLLGNTKFAFLDSPSSLFFVGFTAYAIVRYRLMDITVLTVRGMIFGVVYALILGIPFWLGSTTKSWLPSTALAVFLASLGPFIYNYLRRRAEAQLLRKEHHAHQLLMQASSGMTQIRNIRKLFNLIVHFVPKILKVKNAFVYLLDKKGSQFLLEAIRFKKGLKELPNSIDINESLIEYLKAKKALLLYEELKSQPHTKHSLLSKVLLKMKELSASLILPCFIEDTLLSFLVLGEKKSGRMYTPEDINVLATLTNQAALAIDNARFFERDRENQALLYQSATLADMGVMADSMGHQIKNHIQKMTAEAGAQAGILEELLKEDIDNNKAIELLTRVVRVLYNIENQGEAGGRLIESISKFSRLPQATFREITLKEILDTANDILRFKVKFDEINYNIQIPKNLPILYAHPILSEAFVNLIDNAYDAIREKEAELDLQSKKTGQATSYKGSISFTASHKDNNIEIKVKDNGIGIKKENVAQLFLPFYTTKATSAKGTGLGLFVIKKIINNHKGRITIDSEYMQGTTFTITLPIRQEKRR